MGNDNHEEVIEVESIKDLSETEQVERIADKFAEVSNLYEPLRRDKIVFPAFTMENVPVITAKNVYEVLKDLNVSKSTRTFRP